MLRIRGERPRRVLPGARARSSGTARDAAEDPEARADEPGADAARGSPGRVARAGVDLLVEVGADELEDVSVPGQQRVEVLLVLEPLLALGPRAAVPVDHRQLTALSRRERQRVEQLAERVARRAPHLAVLEEVAVGNVERLVDRRR